MDIKQGELSRLGLIGAVWAVVGFSWVLLDAIIRLAIIAWEGIGPGLSGLQYVLLVLFVVAMAYAEGYRGFQKSFSPRCAARAYWLCRNPEPLAVALAPLFIMGFFRATRAPFLFAWVGTFLIVLMIIGLQLIPQPWRGIVDAGVVVGLSWGLISFLASVLAIFAAGESEVSPAIPTESV